VQGVSMYSVIVQTATTGENAPLPIVLKITISERKRSNGL